MAKLTPEEVREMMIEAMMRRRAERDAPPPPPPEEEEEDAPPPRKSAQRPQVPQQRQRLQAPQPPPRGRGMTQPPSQPPQKPIGITTHQVIPKGHPAGAESDRWLKMAQKRMSPVEHILRMVFLFMTGLLVLSIILMIALALTAK